MPGLFRKILVIAAVDGILLQPLEAKGQRSGPATKIAYKDKSIAPVLKDVEVSAKGFEAFGVVGMISLLGEVEALRTDVLIRSFDCIPIIILDLDYKTSTSRANTRETYLCYYGSCIDAAVFKGRSRILSFADKDRLAEENDRWRWCR